MSSCTQNVEHAKATWARNNISFDFYDQLFAGLHWVIELLTWLRLPLLFIYMFWMQMSSNLYWYYLKQMNHLCPFNFVIFICNTFFYDDINYCIVKSYKVVKVYNKIYINNNWINEFISLLNIRFNCGLFYFIAFAFEL